MKKNSKDLASESQRKLDGRPSAAVFPTRRQLELARHALGLPNKNNTTCRNRFCIGPGGDGYADWEHLVSVGHAVKQTGPLWGGDDMFHLTLTGARAVLERSEHISREDAAVMRKLDGIAALRDITAHPTLPDTELEEGAKQ